MMIENAKDGEGRMAADERARAKAEPTQLRNEAQLNCVSLRSELDDEVTCEAVKGQDERQLRAPLTTPQVTPEVHATRKRTSKVSREDRQNGGAVGRPSCQSSLLRDLTQNFLRKCGESHKEQEKKKDQETEARWT
jgi:hypothetical protein